MREKKEKDVEQATNSSIERIFARKTFPYRQVKMACRNLVSISTLRKELYNSIAQVPAPIARGCLSRREMMGTVDQQEHSPDECCPRLGWSGPRGVSGKGWPGWSRRGMWEGINPRQHLCGHLSSSSRDFHCRIC